ncbi:hypothetical protein CW751_07725 [Brumimicrobium salinarum]|uniref:Uncharacterized protein n=1 Tax=Brumimicrobium salinarum TaxID=2058658 RepID=A0A2I0R3A1_9FLAO|nr:hypothetical protein [Brumimicrobium salinarum]PKR81043.1 hypothetical protein CW751_07725 [Brumimicrobium salinarum]
MRLSILFVLFIFILFSCGSSSALFPKKHLGSYTGKQEAFQVEMGDSPITVPSRKLELTLAYGELWLSSPEEKLSATYSVKAETKMYYALDVQLENGVSEEWQLWKKGNKIIRKPIAPLPEVIFIAD